MHATTIETYTELADDLKVYAFPAYRLATFEKRWNKLVRRAAKLGMEAPEWIKGSLEERVWRDEETGKRMNERYLVIGVRAAPVFLAGWQFICTIQHTEHGNLLRTVPGFDGQIPADYRTAAASWCDHCQTSRRRNETFVVVRDGEHQRVGRNCLADFVASDRDGSSIAAQMNWATQVVSFLDELGGWEGGGRLGFSSSTEGFVARCMAAIAVRGWLSRGKAREEYGVATADLVLSCGTAGRTASNADVYDADTSEFEAEAEAAIEWARAIDPGTTSDYLHNLRVACSFEFLSEKEVGIVASVVPAYRRHLERLAAAARDALLPPRGQRHIGKPGDKFGRKLSAKDKRAGATAHPALQCVVVSSRDIETFYGLTTKIELERTADGQRDVFVWWSSSAPKVEIGATVTVAGTVKKLDEYKGTKQTVLTRCKIV